MGFNLLESKSDISNMPCPNILAYNAKFVM
jgi:hypothetical protein